MGIMSWIPDRHTANPLQRLFEADTMTNLGQTRTPQKECPGVYVRFGPLSLFVHQILPDCQNSTQSVICVQQLKLCDVVKCISINIQRTD